MSFETLRLKTIKVVAYHPYAYRPDGCEEASIEKVYFDTLKNRMCCLLLFDNGAIDLIPISEIDIFNPANIEPAYKVKEATK